MGDDLTDLLLEILEESGAEYVEPDDIVVEEIEEDIPEPEITTPSRKKKVKYEDDLSNYDIPADITPEEMKNIIAQVRRNGKGYGHTPESRMKIGISLTGVERHADTKQKISKTMRGRKHTPEHNERISQAMAGRKRKPMSEETKKKISESMRKKHG